MESHMIITFTMGDIASYVIRYMHVYTVQHVDLAYETPVKPKC